MNDIDLKTFMDETLKGCWPEWKWTDMEYEMWRGYCRKLDFQKARQAIRSWFENSTFPGKRPVLGKLKSVLAAAIQRDESRARGPFILFALTCDPENPKRGGAGYREFSDNVIPSDDECMRRAQYWQDRLSREYGCQYHIIRLWDEKPVESEKSTEQSRLRILNDAASSGSKFAEAILRKKLNEEAKKHSGTVSQAALEFAREYEL